MGDQAVVVQFEHKVSLEISHQVHAFARAIKRNNIKGVTDLLPAFNNLTVCYDPVAIQYAELIENLQNINWDPAENVVSDSKTIHVPVVFGGEFGPDLEEIAQRSGLGSAEVIKLLTSQ